VAKDAPGEFTRMFQAPTAAPTQQFPAAAPPKSQEAPGEFTRRAFLNDRIDLAQAESVADLIDASSVEAARRLSPLASRLFR